MTRAEFRWVLVASLLVLLLASLPTLYAWALANADHVFTGFVYNTEDGNAYIGKMRLGARGEWLFHIFYTPEPHQPAVAFPLHLLLGKLASASGLSLVLVYHLARVLLGLGLLFTVYAFVSYFITEVYARRLAWSLVALGSGFGWLLTALGASHWLGDLALDFLVPEAFVFLVLYSVPHLALAETLLLWSIRWAMVAIDGGSWRWCLFAGLAAFGMTWLVPFYTGVLATALAGAVLLVAILQRRIPWREFGLIVLVGLMALPPLLYNAWLFSTNFAFQNWAAQLTVLSPHPLHYLLAYAWLLVPACWGIALMIKRRLPAMVGPFEKQRTLLPAVWALASLGLAYAPFVSQRRLIVLLQVSLAMLAAAGLADWFRKRPRLQRYGPIVYVTAASLGNLLLVASTLGAISQRPSPVYRSGAEVEALRWLASHTANDEVVLASFEVGNVIPAWTDLRVFAGHGPETLYSGDKQAAIRRFFLAETDDGWRQSLLRDFGLDYVFYGPQERALGEWDPSKAGYLNPVYRVQGYAVYRVDAEGLQP